MVDQPRLALTFEDVLLVPRRSSIRSRRHVSTRSRFTRGVELAIPIVSANMDTVTTAPMAIAMAELGGIGVLHRFLPTEAQAEEARRVKRYLGQVIEQPYTIGPERTVAEAAAEARRLGVTGLVVVDPERRPVGILTARDMRAVAGGAAAQGGGLGGAMWGDTVASAMTPADRLVTARPGIDLDEARKLLDRHRIEKLPLVGDDGRLAGLITLRDIGLRERLPQATRDGQGRLRVAAAVGVRGGYLARAQALLDAGVDALVVDVAHGHADHTIDAVKELKATWPQAEVVAGNVATADGFRDLVEAGADAVKVGIGPGFACTTRQVAGVGVPQLTAILDCAEVARAAGVPLIADGGIRHPGDVAKAIAAGASTVMIGGLFAGRPESPGEVVRRGGREYKVFRGMASLGAAAARLEIEGRGDALDQYVPEGEEMEFPLKGPVAKVVQELVGGLRSGMSYVDATTIPDCWDKASFVRQTQSGRLEARPGLPDA
ncbi:MAG TPA: IMP dehydrogenase [Actinomycetes bacterium]|nr:IMP dehydrogenase [Actinomycetes bacterium]